MWLMCRCGVRGVEAVHDMLTAAEAAGSTVHVQESGWVGGCVCGRWQYGKLSWL
jgi:hypothetical protein